MRVLNLLLALAFSAVYANAQYSTGDRQLRSEAVGLLMNTNRGSLWLQAAVTSDFGRFPSASPVLFERLRPLQDVSLADFRLSTLENLKNVPKEPLNAGDDLGLSYIGLVLHKVFQADRLVMAQMWFAVALSWWCMLFFCLYAFRRRAYLAGILVASVYGLEPELRSFVFGAWQPYEYVSLVPLAAFAVKESGVQLAQSLTSWRSRWQLVSSALLLSMAVAQLAVLVILLTIRGSALVLVLPVFGLVVLEWLLNRRAAAEQPKPAGPENPKATPTPAAWLASREGGLQAGVAVALLGLGLYAGMAAPRAMVAGAYAGQVPDRHVFWHTIWCTLGEFPNEFQFRWSDYEASARASALAGHPVPMYSDEYEEILKNDVLTTLREHPDFLVRMLAQKMEYRLGPFVLALAIFGLSVVFLRTTGPRVPHVSADHTRLVWQQFYPIAYVGLGLAANRVLVLLSSSHAYFYYPTQIGEALAWWVGVALLGAGTLTLAVAVTRGLLTRVRPEQQLAVLASPGESLSPPSLLVQRQAGRDG